MAKATVHGGASNIVDTTAQEPVPQSVQDLDELDDVLEEANAPSETPEPEFQVDESASGSVDIEPAAPVPDAEPPKRNASQPTWAEFAASQGLEGAGDMSRDELVAWWDEQQEASDEG